MIPLFFNVLGDVDFIVSLKESNAKFNFNFKDVYWNSRLQMEHSRLIDFITKSTVIKNDTVVDKKDEIKDENIDGKLVEKVVENNIKNNKKEKKINKNSNNSNNNNHNNNNNNNNNDNSQIKEVVVADMMAGVGPFAVPLALSNITVYANDLNPASYKYLNTNMRINHCEKHLKCFNMCGRLDLKK